jgi:AcrR family transcriptional regulator
MGNLARSLGVAQMTLYNYTSSKQAIINMLPDVLFTGLAPVSAGGAWRTTIASFFTEVYGLLTAHQEITRLVAANPVSSEAQDRHSRAVRAVLENAGYSARDTLTIHRTLSTYTLGFALYEIAHQQSSNPVEGADAAQFRIGLDAVIRAF